MFSFEDTKMNRIILLKILEVIQRLRYYASIIINFYLNAKEKSGALKPVVEIIEKLVVSMYKLVFEAMFKSLVGLVLEKYFGVPANLVDLVDGKVIIGFFFF